MDAKAQRQETAAKNGPLEVAAINPHESLGGTAQFTKLDIKNPVPLGSTNSQV